MNFQQKTGLGTIIRIRKAIDPPWLFAAEFFVACPDGTTIKGEVQYQSKEEIPDKGDSVELVWDGNFWKLAE